MSVDFHANCQHNGGIIMDRVNHLLENLQGKYLNILKLLKNEYENKYKELEDKINNKIKEIDNRLQDQINVLTDFIDMSKTK